jgi:hypothetical protein
VKLSLPDIIAAMDRVREKHGRLDPARVVVHSVDEWRTACLLAGIEPMAHDPKPGTGGLCGSFQGTPVIEAPLICPKGEIVLLRGRGANELAGSHKRHIVHGAPRLFELTWEAIR